MNFSSDRDLLMIEPRVFNDVAFAGQTLVHATDGQISESTLVSDQATFDAAGLDGGSVVLVAGVPHEVVEVIDGHTLTVSLPRARRGDDPIPSAAASNQEVIVRTFKPQAAVVHDMLLKLVGIDVDDPEGGLTEDAVVSVSVVAHLEALGTLEMVYSAAVSVAGEDAGLIRKAVHYRERFAAACKRAVVLIDADGDGRADVRRQLGVSNLVRA